MLRVFDIKYLPPATVNGQILADLVAEFIEDVARDERVEPSILVVSASSPATWEVYIDGAVN